MSWGIWRRLRIRSKDDIIFSGVIRHREVATKGKRMQLCESGKYNINNNALEIELLSYFKSREFTMICDWHLKLD